MSLLPNRVMVSWLLVVLILSACQPIAPTATSTQLPAAATAVGKAPTPLEEALSGKYKGKTVSVGSVLGGSWGYDYEQSLKGFEEKTGITVKRQFVDDGDPAFQAAVAAGQAPDVVMFSWPGAVKGYAKEGKIVDLAQWMDRATLETYYGTNWLDWATMDGPDGPILGGLWFLYNADSLVWYPREAFEKAGYKAPTTWAEMLALSDQIVADGGTPWCIDNSYGFNLGFPAVVWIADIMLRTAPPADYDKWIRGDLPFSSPEVKHAVEVMSDLWFTPGYTSGGRSAINQTSTASAINGLLASPPKCWMAKEPTWVLGFDGESDHTAFDSKVFGKDYDFFVLPSIDAAYGAPIQVESWVHAMFHDRPEVRAFMEYLSTGAADEAWIKQGKHFGFSANNGAQSNWYVQERYRATAEVAAAAQKAGDLHIIAGDSMLPALSDQFFESITAYVDGKIDLDTALQQIDAARLATVGSTTAVPLPPVWLNTVWGSSGSDVYVVGNEGRLLHYDGTAWSPKESGTTNNLSSVWGSAADSVFVAGDNGMILRYDGADWTPMVSGTSNHLPTIWGAAQDDIFVGGAWGTILHYDGSAWSTMKSNARSHVIGLWGASSSDVFATGFDGQILHYDGSVWSQMGDSGTSEELWGIWGSSPVDVYVSGTGGTILHYDGQAWLPMDSGTPLSVNSLWGASPNDIFAVGADGLILHYDGSAWSPVESPTTNELNWVWGSSNHDIFAVGADSTIVHYDGENWTIMDDGSD